CAAVSAITSRSLPRGMNRNEESRMPSSNNPTPPREKKKRAKDSRMLCIKTRSRSETLTAPLRPLIFRAESFVGKTAPLFAGMHHPVGLQISRIGVLISDLPQDGEKISQQLHQISFTSSRDRTKGDSRYL